MNRRFLVIAFLISLTSVAFFTKLNAVNWIVAVVNKTKYDFYFRTHDESGLRVTQLFEVGTKFSKENPPSLQWQDYGTKGSMAMVKPNTFAFLTDKYGSWGARVPWQSVRQDNGIYGQLWEVTSEKQSASFKLQERNKCIVQANTVEDINTWEGYHPGCEGRGGVPMWKRYYHVEVTEGDQSLQVVSLGGGERFGLWSDTVNHKLEDNWEYVLELSEGRRRGSAQVLLRPLREEEKTRCGSVHCLVTD